jgi:hypothetical protein
MIVNKQNLVEHLKCIQKLTKSVDALMAEEKYKDFAKGQGGKDIAKIMNGFDYTKQMLMLSELKIPLKRLCEDITDDLVAK